MNGKYEAIFVLYPRGVRTGGPEALHQLVDMLRSIGQPAFLVPCSGIDKERVREYQCYDAPEAKEPIDSPRTAIVVPETHIDKLNRFRHATKFCWWLSIDNSPLFMSERILTRLHPESPRNALRIVKHSLLSTVQSLGRPRKYRDIIHLTQSSYAWSFISLRLATNPSALSDYTLQNEFDAEARSQNHRGRTVAYNPAKGREVVERIIRACPADIEWLPIQGMSRAEVVSTLQTTSIYLDMGHHPGKDRLPREAALAGALTVVSRRGAGSYYNDVPVPWEHKISLDADEVQSAVTRINELLQNVSTETKKQTEYVRRILAEKSQFKREVTDIFVHSRLGLDNADYSGMNGGLVTPEDKKT